MKVLTNGTYVTAPDFSRVHPVQTLHSFYVDEMGMDEDLARVASGLTVDDVWTLNLGAGDHILVRSQESGIRIAMAHRRSMAVLLHNGETVVVNGSTYRVRVHDENWEEPIAFERLDEQETFGEQEAALPLARAGSVHLWSHDNDGREAEGDAGREP